ncbi:MAG TPA: PQQ-binding-like beta-propeller repeat protein [Ktedonobacterales bacterium]|nr:PQQ-binding-like beta-propeller repeat protein [Ktedonobacterales bacterium]
MQRQRRHRLSLVWVSIFALLGLVACGDSGPRYSVFTQQPQQGSGAAIDLQSADQIHPLWAYQPQIGTPESITSAAGVVYLSYLSNGSALGTVGAGGNGNPGNITPTPTVSGGSVSALDAIDAHSGRRLWRFQAPEQPDFGATPLVANETIYIALTYQVCAVNAHSGVARWCAEVIDRAKDEEYIVDGEMAFENGLLFVGAYHTLIAVDAATGTRMWSVQTPMRSSHLVTGNDLVYVSAADGQLSAFDASTGQQVWVATQVPDTPFPNTFAPVPYLDQGTLYVLSGRSLAAYQGRRGDVLWRVSLDGGEHGGEITPPLPVFANVEGTPYLLALERNDSTLISPISTHLVAYNLQTHQQLWSKQLPGQDRQALALSSGVVYVASATIDRKYPSPSDRHFWLSMMDLRSGQVARQLQDNDASFRVSQLVGANGLLFVLGYFLDPGEGSRVYALGR